MNEVMYSTGKDDWETPQALFDELDSVFHFTLDVCANEHNHKCDRYFTEELDGLKQNWDGEVVWCNPPYSNKKQNEWVKRCYEHGQKGYTAVMLIPARTDTARFHNYIWKKATKIIFIRGRLKFGDSKNSAPFPSMIVIYEKENDIYGKEKSTDTCS